MFFRHPKTIGNRRAVQVYSDEEVSSQKIRRRPHLNLKLSDWEDISPSMSRSWKKHRKEKYKLKV